MCTWPYLPWPLGLNFPKSAGNQKYRPSRYGYLDGLFFFGGNLGLGLGGLKYSGGISEIPPFLSLKGLGSVSELITPKFLSSSKKKNDSVSHSNKPNTNKLKKIEPKLPPKIEHKLPPKTEHKLPPKELSPKKLHPKKLWVGQVKQKLDIILPLIGCDTLKLAKDIIFRYLFPFVLKIFNCPLKIEPHLCYHGVNSYHVRF